MTQRIDRRAFGIGAVATGAVLSGTAVLGAKVARAQAPPLKIGRLTPVSGFEALIGQHMRQAVAVAKPMLKDMGYNIEVIDADTESKPDVARTQAEKLIQEGCHMLVGAFDSGQTFAIAQVAEQHGIPHVIDIGADPAITEQGYKFVFRNFPTAIMLGSQGLGNFKALFAATGKTPTTAVLMHLNDTFGVAMTKGIKAYAAKVGLPFKFVADIDYAPDARDLSAEVAKAKAAKAELQVVVTRLNDAILLVREMVKQKYDTMGIISPGSPGMYQSQFFKALGKYANYCITNIPWFDPKQALAGTFQAAYKKAYPDDFAILDDGFTFEGLLVCADAYKRAGSTKPQALVEALKATHIDNRVMLGGPITFDAKGQNTHLPSAVVQNLDGRPTVVLPEANAAAKPVFPMPAWSQRT
ncbi:MAG TPA: ABC transporter substrate-binding protein [Stellaceae bacterium]|nr:ABC transporter substrate-binding protein [Stellaceae bacterium]